MGDLLKDKVAIVTGGGRGIGRAAAIALAAEGAAVVVNALHQETVAETTAKIRAAGGRAVECAAPVGDEQTAELLVSTALKEFGGLHILVNSVATLANAPAHEMTGEMFDKVVRAHLYGTFFNCREAIRRVMIPQRYGRIINVISRAGLRGYRLECNYAAAKAGIVGLSLTLAQELLEYKITVNCIAPVAWTDLADKWPEPQRSQSWAARSKSVLGRVAMPEDTVPSFLFFASDMSAYLTGQIIQATGEPITLM